jgi:hypothetical protein
MGHSIHVQFFDADIRQANSACVDAAIVSDNSIHDFTHSL